MRAFEQDIITAVKNKLDSDFNTMIDTIRTERNDNNIPYAGHITYDELTFNYPEISIELGTSDNNTEILSDDILLSSEKYELKINVVMQTALNLIGVYANYYREAIKRVLTGIVLDITGFSWIRFKSTEQDDLADANGQTYKNILVTFEVQIN